MDRNEHNGINLAPTAIEKMTGTSSLGVKQIMSFAVLLLTLVIGAITSCRYVFHKKQPKQPSITSPAATEKGHAELILKNLAVGMRMYSTMTGGGGENQFTGDITQIQRYVMEDAFAACNEKPYHGFIVELQEYPDGDNFKTNFRFTAKPAPGFTGAAYAVDKSEEIITLDFQER